VLTLQDHWATLEYIRSQTGLQPKVARKKKILDWPSLLADAQSNYARRSNSNPFGIENEEWAQQYDGQVEQEKNLLSDKWFLDFMAKSKGWEDLGLLLRELKELGAQPLIISAPIHGPYFDYLGVSAAARQTYYEKLRRTVGAWGVPLLDFEGHDGDKSFLIDPLFHLSSVGWVYYAQALDSFFHGTLEAK
jgi:D-alanine transfer protein